VKALIRAISFLTILPVGRQGEMAPDQALAESMAWFPAVGLFPGALMLAAALLSPRPLPPSVAVFMALLAGVIITGGLHLDGLADWADGLGGKNPEGVLRIMKDTRLGAFGASAMVLLLLGKYAAALAIISRGHDPSALILAPVLARWAMVLVALTSPYPRIEGGTARAFVGRGGTKVILKATALTALVIALTSPVQGTLYAAAAAGTGWLLRCHSLRRVRGITGDILGATCELVELAILLISSIVIR
jgi:adenosylcobinamide-GDP ribazoletransferase